MHVMQSLEVTALHPPLAVEIRLMALLLGVLVLGMAAGFFCPQPVQEICTGIRVKPPPARCAGGPILDAGRKTTLCIDCYG